MPDYSLIDRQLLNDLLLEAANNPRLRKNRNFHANDQSACHRLANALQPGTYVQPHRHLDDQKAESMVMLSGELGVLLFDDMGQVVATHRLQVGGEVIGINIEARTYHAVVALSPCVFFESKAGPYIPVAPEEWASWAPAAGDAKAVDYLAWMRSLFD
ncbi:WbuC family cupin fold metalloprotein [Chitinibacter sp. GC72]|uniref:WbuC family cupin fold metalloprotein n=1 Tax=Chitinibacter sp. GC72 TaxID=1526917 RepID=UPI0012FA1E7B|nr:WbuC family cupin fold metalloprotein [Chitinibacter sp. GC72]